MVLRRCKRNLLRRQARTQVVKPPIGLSCLTGSYTCSRPWVAFTLVFLSLHPFTFLLLFAIPLFHAVLSRTCGVLLVLDDIQLPYWIWYSNVNRRVKKKNFQLNITTEKNILLQKMNLFLFSLSKKVYF